MYPASSIREATPLDSSAISSIYNYYVANSISTFDTEQQTEKQFADKIKSIQKDYPFLVLEENNVVVGYAYAFQWKDKAAYKHTAETTVYIHPDHHGKKYGLRLYNALLSSLPLFDIANAIACITIPNETSEKLHLKLGFTKQGTFSKVGYKFERWIDVGYWQKQV